MCECIALMINFKPIPYKSYDLWSAVDVVNVSNGPYIHTYRHIGLPSHKIAVNHSSIIRSLEVS